MASVIYEVCPHVKRVSWTDRPRARTGRELAVKRSGVKPWPLLQPFEMVDVYNKVEITFTTHDVGGLSPRDVNLARCLDQASSVSFMPRPEGGHDARTDHGGHETRSSGRRGRAARADRLDHRSGLGEIYYRRACRLEDAVRASDEAAPGPRLQGVRAGDARPADRRRPDPGLPTAERRVDESYRVAGRRGTWPRSRRGVLRTSRQSALSGGPVHPQAP